MNKIDFEVFACKVKASLWSILANITGYIADKLELYVGDNNDNR